MKGCATLSRRRLAVALLLRSAFIGSALSIPHSALAFGLSTDDLEGGIEFLNDTNTAYRTGRVCLSENLDEDRGLCDREAIEGIVDIATNKIGEKAEETAQKAVVKGIRKLAKKVGWKGAVNAANAAAEALPAISPLITADEFGTKVGELAYKKVVGPYLEERYAKGERRRNMQVPAEASFMSASKDVAREFLRRHASDGRKAADAYLADKMRQVAQDQQRPLAANALGDLAATQEEEGAARNERPWNHSFTSDATPATGANFDFLSPSEDLFLKEDDTDFRFNLDDEEDDVAVSDINARMDTFQNDAEEQLWKEQTETRRREREIAASIHDQAIFRDSLLLQNIARQQRKTWGSSVFSPWINEEGILTPSGVEVLWASSQGSSSGPGESFDWIFRGQRVDSTCRHIKGLPLRSGDIDVPSSTRGRMEALLRAVRKPREFFKYENVEFDSLAKVWTDYDEGTIDFKQAIRRLVKSVRSRMQVANRNGARDTIEVELGTEMKDAQAALLSPLCLCAGEDEILDASEVQCVIGMLQRS